MSDHVAPIQPRACSLKDRRLGPRFSIRGECAFELKAAIDHGPSAMQRGAAYSVNVSTDGILLLLDREPRIRQLVEIHNCPSPKPESAVVFEIRWIKPLPLGSVTPRYLTGCRLVLGRIPFFLFQRRNLERPFSGLQF